MCVGCFPNGSLCSLNSAAIVPVSPYLTSDFNEAGEIFYSKIEITASIQRLSFYCVKFYREVIYLGHGSSRKRQIHHSIRTIITKYPQAWESNFTTDYDPCNFRLFC
uniref:Uncharacterized protein n=1 Tax=Triticum urartu TaxID=4572 RepID=A0A8R7QWZ6_TRIUA